MDEEVVATMNDMTSDTTPRDPYEDGAQGVLPLDLDPDQPVPFRLTPKARRLVAPDDVPVLEVVAPSRAPTAEEDEDGAVPVDLDDPHDPRSARARAMRRGGLSVPAIARRLDVDELAVRTWTGDLDPRGRRRPRLRAVHGNGAATPRTADATAADPADERLAQHHAAFAECRRRAADDAGTRMADPGFVRGLSLTVAAAELDEHALLVALRDQAVARTVRQWLVDHAHVDPRELRVVVRLGSTEGADLVLHRWADALDLPVERLARTHWRSAPSEDAVEALLRVPDAEVAARVAGWRDALLGTDDLGGLPTGVGF